MDDGGGCVLVVVVIALVVYLVWGFHEIGEDHAHKQFRECRALLATDSAAVLRYRSECAKWTLPPREAR